MQNFAVRFGTGFLPLFFILASTAVSQNRQMAAPARKPVKISVARFGKTADVNPAYVQNALQQMNSILRGQSGQKLKQACAFEFQQQDETLFPFQSGIETPTRIEKVSASNKPIYYQKYLQSSCAASNLKNDLWDPVPTTVRVVDFIALNACENEVAAPQIQRGIGPQIAGCANMGNSCFFVLKSMPPTTSPGVIWLHETIHAAPPAGAEHSSNTPTDKASPAEKSRVMYKYPTLASNVLTSPECLSLARIFAIKAATRFGAN